jgi:hypothetical protein
LERVFSKEITFFFYLNLNNLAFITNKAYSQTKNKELQDTENVIDTIDHDLLFVASDVFSHGSPKDRLIKILQTDEEIKQHFYDWINISMNYQKATSDKMFENIKKIGIENQGAVDSRYF